MAMLDRSLLAFLGVLIAHEVAYLTSSIAGYGNSVAHGHLKTAWLVGSVALLAVATRAVVTSLRRRRHHVGQPTQLAALIATGYVSLEQLERLADGYSLTTLFSEPVFWIGIAAAPLIAVLLTRALRTVELVAARLIDSRDDCPVSAVVPQTLGATSVRTLSTLLRSSVVSLRGPPVGFDLR